MALKDNCVYLNVQIDKDLKRRIRVWAANHATTATQMVINELTRFLDAEEKAEKESGQK